MSYAPVMFTIRPLPAALRPVFITRHCDTTLVTVDPTTPKVELLLYLFDHLASDEITAIYDELGMQRGDPLPEAYTEGLVTTCRLPERMLTARGRAERRAASSDLV